MPETTDTQKPLSFEVHQLDNDEIVATVTLDDETRITYLSGTKQDKAKITATIANSASEHLNKKCYVCEFETEFGNEKPIISTDTINYLEQEFCQDLAKTMAIARGFKIRHRHFSADEYIYYKDGNWFTEGGYQLDKIYWFNMGESWQNGWTIVDNK